MSLIQRQFEEVLKNIQGFQFVSYDKIMQGENLIVKNIFVLTKYEYKLFTGSRPFQDGLEYFYHKQEI